VRSVWWSFPFLTFFTLTTAAAVYTKISSFECMIWLYSRSQLYDAVYSFSLLGIKLNFLQQFCM
jgi:hypothetical protein